MIRRSISGITTWRKRVIPVVVIFSAGLLCSLSAEGFRLEDVPVASQTGPSCGFFANVPAVTLSTGIHISASRSFVQSIYGLRRGDFRYQRSFDKRMFFELFSLPYESVKVEHPPQPAKELKPLGPATQRFGWHRSELSQS